MGTREKERLDYLKTLLGAYSNSNWDGKKVSFIVSTGRTGTWFLIYFLSQFSHIIDARHEPDPDFLKLGVRYARRKVSFQKAVKTIKLWRQYVCNEMDRNHKRIYIESNNNLFSLIPALWEIFPEAKILHVIRDGRDFARSVMSRGHYTKEDKIHSKRNLRLEAAQFPDDLYYSHWKKKMSLLEKTSWEWQKKDEIIYRSIINDARAKTVKFEDVFNSNENGDVLFDACRFLNIDLNRETFNRHFHIFTKRKVNHKKLTFPHWKDWSEEQCDQFNKIAGFRMKLYGYSK